jgi:transcriptional regulator with XRE-family HTH domain
MIIESLAVTEIYGRIIRMSNIENEFLFGFGARIAEERTRLKYSQAALAMLFGKTARTQGKYESEETAPDLIYLFNLDRLGADIYYIVTGQRSANSFSTEEMGLVSSYRSLDTRGKAGVLGMVETLGANPATHKKQAPSVHATAAAATITGKKAQVIQGNNMTGKTTIQLGRKKKDAV